MNTERNWLIRTSQNQILGPVTKPKLLEFVKNGALGLSDEVSSGNGYWFHLREKELVEKYLYGDIPQSYNPISEARTVLARKDAPEKTTSINNSPANITQIIKLNELNLEQVLPKSEDLEFPDLTLVKKVSSTSEIKLPKNDDLEFPDLSKISKSSESQVTLTKIETKNISNFNESKSDKLQPISNLNQDEIKLPDSSDLEYPELDLMENEVKFEVPHLEETKTILAPKEVKPLDVKLELQSKKTNVEGSDLKSAGLNKEPPKTLLAERKTKNSKKDESLEKVPKPSPKREISPELKNRNDSYLLFILFALLILIIVVVFYYYRFILNKPLPV